MAVTIFSILILWVIKKVITKTSMKDAVIEIEVDDNND